MMNCFALPTATNEHIDPKTFMANERTFIAWLHMAATLGSMATALVAIGKANENTLGATQIMASVLMLTAIGFCGHSMRIFFGRNKTIRRKEDMHDFDDFYGPAAVTTLMTLSWASIFALSLVKLASNDTVHAAVHAMYHGK
mmetsp:Transcript_11462/g.28114  ORF Transcript_11462/g.28114 Transcript_11462/m.28114 type:complete len:142 (+) Transcript_11462:117-542(+)